MKSEFDQALLSWKQRVVSVYPQLAKTYQIKKLKLMITNLPKDVAGQAWRSSSTIALNPTYCAAYPEDMKGQILGHEVAHIVAPLLHGDKHEGHTNLWKRVMKELGLEPDTYHTLEIPN